MAIAPTATETAARLKALVKRRSREFSTSTGGEIAPRDPRRNSSATKVAMPNIRKIKKRIRNVVSTVSTAEAKIAAKESMARKSASRSVTVL